MAKKIAVTDVALRDGHQSLLATRMLTSDMLKIAEKMDKVGYWSLETWGGATFDSCIRFLNEDPWERIRNLKKAMPNTKMQMLLRGQNLLGYRHYADDVVEKFVETAVKNGVEVFRVFDALNDTRNMKASFDAIKKQKAHIQGCISYAVTPVHTIEKYAELAKELEKMGADSICIKDMSGLLKPYIAEELVKAIKQKTSLPLSVHSHSTTGMSVATLIKAIEAGADMIDTAISPLSMGTSHSPTESIVEILKNTEFDTQLDLTLLSEIAEYFKEAKKKYADYASSFTGVDTRILLSQVPGGMLSNLENQLREQNALDKLDDVLKEITVVQKDFGYPPLVTPTSQIVGTQSVFNVLFGRYNKLTAESKNLLIGNYGRTPAKPDADLVKKALQELAVEKTTDCRPADLLPNELDKLRAELEEKKLLDNISDEDLMTYAMFPQVAPKFFAERANGPVEIKPSENTKSSGKKGAEAYIVNVDGVDYNVSVREEGTILIDAGNTASAPKASGDGKVITAPVAGTVFKLPLSENSEVVSGDTVIILESMKMELEVKTADAGKVRYLTKEGTSVAVGDPLVEIV
ncbi:MAG: sodium-extruding oxaloacetate decarboxylase subunit alpha [Spirochaetales bacterium]|nr:sodium-extruding oxaloacetate decarboxylase subunit alpha [Spirochaetales bacterium]